MTRDEAIERVFDQAGPQHFNKEERESLQELLENPLIVKWLQHVVYQGEDISKSLQFADLTTQEGIQRANKQQGKANGYREAVSEFLEVPFQEEEENG